jgi:predicted RNA polymerase sigma factor
MADGPEAALVVLDAVRDDRRLARHHLLGAVRGDVTQPAGRHSEAAAELEQPRHWPGPDMNGSC